ncbi:MAG: MBL fold metallo-hydrolase [Saprospiraceae bacterium]|nr:MBL fold metallo-hydrolase [Saprospiraceae bacterium]
MLFQHIYDKSLAQASYLIGCQKVGVAAVIDPKRDVDTYIDIAKQNNMKITHIFETHIHADFLSGSRELAALTGADMYLSDDGGPDWQYQFAHQGLKDGDKVKMGNLIFEIIHTPGHTPESISIMLTDTPASKEPVMMFTGDFVFVGAVPSTTVGYEKIRNWALQYKENKGGFVDYLLADQPEPPKYFAMMKKLNKVERPLLTEVPKLKELSSAELQAAMNKGIKLIDARNKTDFAAGFIPGSINIQGNNAFATWAGWFLTYEEPFILLAAPEQLDDLTRKLMRIGLDNIMGFVPSTEVYQGALQVAQMIGYDDLKTKLNDNHSQIVDLRGVAEFNAGHIKGADNIFVGTILNNTDKISKDKVIIHCQGGDRSSIAYSLLVKEGLQMSLTIVRYE